MPRRGPRKIEASPGRPGVTVSRRRACRIMGEDGPVGACGLGGRAPRTHICGDLAYVCVGASWSCARLLVDLYNRGIVGHSAGPGKDARPVKPAFATPSFPIPDIEVFHTDRGSEFDNAEIDLMLEALGIERSLSAKGCPHDSAVDESADGIPRAELARRETERSARRESPVLFADVVNETPCKPDRHAALEGESGLVRINLTMRIRTLTCGSFLQMA